MTNEELERFQRIERTLEFIVGNQARFDANMQRIEEVQQRTDERLDRLTVEHAGLEGVVMTLAQSHVELVDSHKQLAQAQKIMAEAQTELKDRVDSFITFVEKYISSRNGGERTH